PIYSTMQKRGRAVETQKLKRTMKSRKTVPLRESTNCSLAYVKLIAVWFSIVSADVLTGFRVELMWPCWMLLCSFYDSMQRRSAFVHLTSQTTTFLFVCVTATSDLICYLFIPVRLLIFLATTYVWMNLVWHVNGGFLPTMRTLLGDKTQAAPVVVLWSYFVIFEIFCRMRCDYLIFLKYLPFSAWLEEQDGCLHMQGMHSGFQQAFNALFSAHCIGYPLIVISFNAKYYYKEWRLRLQQGDVSDTNENLFRLLADSIPMDFDATRMYRRLDYMDDEDDDYLEEVLPIEPPPEKPFLERYPNANLSGEKQYLLMLSPEERRVLLTPQELQRFEKFEARRNEKKSSKAGAENTTPVASPAENGHSSSAAANGVQRRHNGSRPSISSKTSRTAATNGRMQQQPAGQTANGRRTEKGEEEDWNDSSSSEGEVQLNRRGRTRPLTLGKAVMAVGSFFWRVLTFVVCLVPFVRYFFFEEEEAEELTPDEIRLKRAAAEAHFTHTSQIPRTPPSQHAQPPRRGERAAKSNGVLVESSGGGGAAGRKRMANGEPQHNGSAASAANGRSSRHDHAGSASRSNGLGAVHDLDSGFRDVSRESARTQHSEDSEQRYNGGLAARVCGVECGKLASEVGRLRNEMRQVRQAEEAARLHATNCSNGEKNAAAECGQLKGRIEQLMNKVSSIERQREQERATAAAAERKAAESAARAAELERELQKERVERREEREKGREKSETVSETQQLLREKEAAWEREAGRLRADSRTKDEVIMEMQAELTKLRVIAKSAVEAEDLRAELSLLRDKTLHLEENLAEENKLKQELFRALRNTQAERDRATRQYDYSSSSSFYPLSPSLGSPGSNGTHSVLGSGSGYASDLQQPQQPQ
ncbi:maco-1, partial [Pristionchus pacificus]